MTDTAPTYQAALEQLQNLGLSKLQVAGALMRQIEIQAYMLSNLDMFYFSTWAAIAAIAIVWMGRRPQPPQAGALPPAAD
jgi:DHA2 family multidrug resistance protein